MPLFTPKNWQDAPSTATPITSVALEDVETRVTDYADDSRQADSVINVKWPEYGAVGNGSADDTAEIQAALDAASPGATIFFPPGWYKFSTLTITKPVTFAGSGWWSEPNDVFGHAWWNDTAHWKGSVLWSTATTGNAITCNFSLVAAINMYDLMLLGPGSGTSSGLALGDHPTASVNESHFQNVMVANFSTCWDLEFVVSCTFVGCRARACVTGFRLNNTVNQNAFYNTEVQFSSDNAILLGDTDYVNRNSFHGGLLQNISGVAGIQVNKGHSNTFDGFYIEGVTATNSVLFSSFGEHNALTNCYYSSNVTDLAKTASNDSIIGPLYSVTTTKVIEVVTGTRGVRIDQTAGPTSHGGVVTNNGTDTFRLSRLYEAVTWNPASTADGAMTSGSFTVNDAELGDVVVASIDATGGLPVGALMSASVTAADTIGVTIFNKTGGVLDIASCTLRIHVWKA